MGVDKLQHAASHAMGGSDPVSPASIGAMAAAIVYSGGTAVPDPESWTASWSGSGGVLLPLGNNIYCIQSSNLLSLDVTGDEGLDGQFDFSGCINLTSLVLGAGDPVWSSCSVTVPPIITGLTKLQSLDLTNVPIADSSAIDALVITLSANATAGGVTGGSLGLGGDSPPAQPTLSSVEVQRALANLAVTLGWTITLAIRTVFDLAIDSTDNTLLSYSGSDADLGLADGLKLTIVAGDGFTAGDYIIHGDAESHKMRTDRSCGTSGSTGGIAILVPPSS